MKREDRVERKDPLLKGIYGTIQDVDENGRALVLWDKSTGTRENKALSKWIKLKSIRLIKENKT